MNSSLSKLYDDYVVRYNGLPKHDFSHFIRIISMWSHHNTYIRPKIRWWNDVNKN
jgi:hypothetical protein